LFCITKVVWELVTALLYNKSYVGMSYCLNKKVVWEWVTVVLYKKSCVGMSYCYFV
jgi:hypothetical protein